MLYILYIMLNISCNGLTCLSLEDFLTFILMTFPDTALRPLSCTHMHTTMHACVLTS